MDHKIILKCRLCLDEFDEDRMFDLFTRNASKDSEEEGQPLVLHEKVEYCCGVKIRDSAEMPSKICIKCNEMTKIWFNFRKMCINSQVYLESLCKDRSTALNQSHKGNFLEFVVEDLQTFRAQARKTNNALTIKLESLDDADCIEDDVAEDNIDVDDVIGDIFEDEAHELVERKEMSEIADATADGTINMIIDAGNTDAAGSHDYDINRGDSETRTFFNDDKIVLQNLKVEDAHIIELTSNIEDGHIVTSKGRSNSKRVTKRSNSTTKKLRSATTTKKSNRSPAATSYMCSICGNVYMKKNSFKYHMSLHSNVKPHECELCGKSFRHVSELKSHMRRHTGEKPYKCSYCDRHFVDRSERHRHERVHTNTRPYACNICGKRFTYSVILKNHLKYHSGVKEFNCLVCDKSFTLPHQLKAHLQTLTHKHKADQFVAPYNVVYE